MNKPLGLYIHIPFCKSKCAYCNFYSFTPSEGEIDRYLTAVKKTVADRGGEFAGYDVTSVYIGGGTPSLMGDGIKDLLCAVKTAFRVADGAEITAEVNPDSAEPFIAAAADAGVNRVSLGVQSSDDKMLAQLGRIHTAHQAEAAVKTARAAGINNLSLDLMIALPDDSEKTLSDDLSFILSADPEHISAYILKAEKGTPLYKNRGVLPDSDTAAARYISMCETLENAGYRHYEISNFAKPGFEGRHNLNYWLCGEYLGLGPSAHSFYGGKRRHYSADIDAFYAGAPEITDGTGGGEEERFMLALRLLSGVKYKDFPFLLTDGAREKITRLKCAGYISADSEKIHLTNNGFLLSNSIITELLP